MMNVGPISQSRPFVTVIEASRGWSPLNLRELWQYREVFYTLVWRDIKVRYRQTLIGATWTILQPLLTMGVLTIFLGKIAKIPSDGVPYAVFSLSGLVPWLFFANGLNHSSNSLAYSTHLISKVYFPRLILPAARVVSGIPDLALSLLILLAIVRYYDISYSLSSLALLPAFVLLASLTALGFGLWLAALNVKYRDVQHAIPFLIQLWLFATPIVYPSSLVPRQWRTLYGLNPMVGVVDGFRWLLLGSGEAPGLTVIVSTTAALVTLITGAFFFRRAERTFADVL